VTRRALPLPLRFLLLVLVVVVLPLVFMGFWLAGGAARAGEELLRSRLRQTNERVTAELASNWIRPRSALLSFGEHPLVQQTLEGGGPPAEVHASASSATLDASPASPDANTGGLALLFDSLPESVVELTLRDLWGAQAARLSRGVTALPTFTITLPVHARPGGRLLGELEAVLLGDAVMGPGGGLGSAAGAVVAVLDPASGSSLRGLPFDPAALASARFEWDGASWVSERRILLDPRLDVISASPLAEFTSPFEAAARRGLAVLLAVTVVATVLAALLTRRMTRSLSRLAGAAESLSRGDLAVRLPSGGGDEVGRVTEAFNRMAESLKRTVAELSQREALAAVGSFASELAHEVRNPLTSIKVDLQYVEERLPDGSEARAVQRGALEEVLRLDRTVAGVLQIARSGQIEMRPLDVREPLRGALHLAGPLAAEAGVKLREHAPDEPTMILGDAGALRQLFTNVIVNAVQAVGSGGTVEVHAAAAPDGTVLVRILDDGPGIPPEALARVREPFFSARSEGTGLGLAVADRIAAAHQAELRIDSEVGKGTEVSVRFEASGSGLTGEAVG
jgi:signal transduction histidine kinase